MYPLYIFCIQLYIRTRVNHKKYKCLNVVEQFHSQNHSRSLRSITRMRPSINCSLIWCDCPIFESEKRPRNVVARNICVSCRTDTVAWHPDWHRSIATKYIWLRGPALPYMVAARLRDGTRCANDCWIAQRTVCVTWYDGPRCVSRKLTNCGSGQANVRDTCSAQSMCLSM